MAQLIAQDHSAVSDQLLRQPLVISVILNTNRKQDTLECIQSLSAGSYPHHRVIILDNTSNDGSVEAIQIQFPDVQILPLATNLGYAGNNNRGIHAALEQGADWVFVLNEDTTLAPDCIEKLIRVGQTDEKIGVLGPLVYHHNEPQVIQSAGGWLNHIWESGHSGQNEPDQGQYNHPRQVDWISGCAILVRRETIEQIGVLDERFFYYWEETEWCLRAAKAGWRIFHVPEGKLWHKGVQRDYHPSPNVTYYSTRNRLLMMKKHHAPAQIWFMTGFRLFKTLISWTIRPRWTAQKEHRQAMWQGVTDFLGQRWGMRPR